MRWPLALVALALDAPVRQVGSEGAVRSEALRPDVDLAATARAVERRFRDGMLVHMKRGAAAERFGRQAARWAAQGHVSNSLSYSLIHPQLAMQRLWVAEGWLFDLAQCSPFAGGVVDLWTHNEVQHDSEHRLDAGRNGELLRMALTRYRRGEAGLHLAEPWPTFVAWAVAPERWSAAEWEALLATSPYGENHTVPLAPDGAEVAQMLRQHAPAAGFGGLVEALLADAERQPVERFTEVLAGCPLESVVGFLARKQRGGGGGLDRTKAAQVLAAAKLSLSQPLVVAEYEFEDSDFSDATLLPKLEPAGLALEPPRLRFRAPFQAALKVHGVFTDAMHWLD